MSALIVNLLSLEQVAALTTIQMAQLTSEQVAC